MLIHHPFFAQNTALKQYGDQVEEFHGLRFVYQTEESLSEAIGDEYEIVESERYAEMEEADSLYIVLRKRG